MFAAIHRVVLQPALNGIPKRLIDDRLMLTGITVPLMSGQTDINRVGEQRVKRAAL